MNYLTAFSQTSSSSTPQSSRQYRCTDISDIRYSQLGVLRCLSSSTAGQEFLQVHADQGVANIEPGHFFIALKSSRRLANITSFNELLAAPMKLQSGGDRLGGGRYHPDH